MKKFMQTTDPIIGHAIVTKNEKTIIFFIFSKKKTIFFEKKWVNKEGVFTRGEKDKEEEI